MTNQDIVDDVEDALPSDLDSSVKEKVLSAVWFVLNNELGMDADIS